MAVQNPLNAQNAKINTAGGQSSSLNLAAGTTQIKTGPGRVMSIAINTVGTAGTFAVYDVASVGGATASTLMWEGTPTTAAGGAPIVLNLPFTNGLVFTVPTSAVMAIYYV